MDNNKSICEESNNVLCFKILVIGCAAVGKTCCIRKYCHNQFTHGYQFTSGYEVKHKVIYIKDKDQQEITCRLMLVDIAGQDCSPIITRPLYKDAQGCIIVCDLDSTYMEIIHDITLWKNQIDEKVVFPGTVDKLPCVLWANKNDIAGENFSEVMQKNLEKFQFDKIFRTSAKTGEGLSESMQYLSNLIFQKHKQINPQLSKHTENNIIKPEDSKITKKSWCCW
ncbi:Rab32 [Hexamita inflata]|uniref:Putative n=1 Tax=Hexamita inflata TaxID=28002 RepID=A0AA86NHQ5_9EUKA|nr:Rab32 [Hexamita inflata]